MVKRVFIYGRFQTGIESMMPPLMLGAPLIPPPPRSDADLATEAIEILREFSVLELVGKVYVLTSNRNYQPVTPLGVQNFSWYGKFLNASRAKDRFFFKAKDGDLWQVPWIRQESDESGAYIAVGLKHD